jgi:hypothetical protein
MQRLTFKGAWFGSLPTNMRQPLSWRPDAPPGPVDLSFFPDAVDKGQSLLQGQVNAACPVWDAMTDGVTRGVVQ